MTVIATLKEVKNNENRVGLTPEGVRKLIKAGHQVIVQKQAGVGSGFPDAEYRKAGAAVMGSPLAVVKKADIIVKVKEPIRSEYELLDACNGKTLFTYLHLAADEPELTRRLLKNNITAIGYETVEGKRVRLPLLAPMSEVAGVLSVQYGAEYLQMKYGGAGKTLGSITDAEPAQVVVIGGGTVGTSAAKTATGLGCKVTLVERSPKRIAQLKKVFKNHFGTVLFNNVSFIQSSPANVRNVVKSADLLVGAVLVPGAKAPKVVTEKMVRSMHHGAVIIDVAIDQGGCIWGSKPTTHSDPIYHLDGKIYCCVTNMPGQVARQSTQALTQATLPYVLRLARSVNRALKTDAGLQKGVSTSGGKLRLKAVAKALNMMSKYEEG